MMVVMVAAEKQRGVFLSLWGDDIIVLPISLSLTTPQLSLQWMWILNIEHKEILVLNSQWILQERDVKV